MPGSEKDQNSTPVFPASLENNEATKRHPHISTRHKTFFIAICQNFYRCLTAGWKWSSKEANAHMSGGTGKVKLTPCLAHKHTYTRARTHTHIQTDRPLNSKPWLKIQSCGSRPHFQPATTCVSFPCTLWSEVTNHHQFHQPGLQHHRQSSRTSRRRGGRPEKVSSFSISASHLSLFPLCCFAQLFLLLPFHLHSSIFSFHFSPCLLFWLASLF